MWMQRKIEFFDDLESLMVVVGVILKDHIGRSKVKMNIVFFMEDYLKGSTINDSVSVFLRYLIGRCQQTHETHLSKIVSKYTHSK